MSKIHVQSGKELKHLGLKCAKTDEEKNDSNWKLGKL